MVLAFHEQPWEESCILHFDDNGVKMFGHYRGLPSLRPQKSFRRSGASSPLQCLSTPFRRLNGSRTPPSGKSTSGVSRARSRWARPSFPQTAASQTCWCGSDNLPQQLLLAPGHRDQELRPSSVPFLICTTQGQHVPPETGRSRGWVLWLPQGQSQLLH